MRQNKAQHIRNFVKLRPVNIHTYAAHCREKNWSGCECWLWSDWDHDST